MKKTLDIKFTRSDSFYRAIDFFDEESLFFYDEYNEEFKTISFPVPSNDEANILEEEITKELIENDIHNFYFEIN
jgi:fatty acid-binding protein DegV